MDNGRNGGFFLFGLVAVLVLYYGFHMDGLAWILKTAFAGVILFIALAIGATVYLIWYSTKKRKEKMAERDRKKSGKGRPGACERGEEGSPHERGSGSGGRAA